MTIYKLKEDTEGQVRKSYIKFLPFILLASAPALIMAFILRKETPFVLYAMIFALLFASIVAYILSKTRRASFLLIVAEDSIKLHQSGKSDVVIQRDEIKTILIDKFGLRIKSNDPSVGMFIPNDLENFDKLKSELNTWSIIEDGQRNQVRQIAILIFVIFLLIGGYITKNPIFGYTLLALLAIFCIYLYSENYKTLLVTKDKWKRFRIIVSFILFGFIILNYLLNLFK